MRKFSWKTCVALALFGAGLAIPSAVRAADPAVGVARVQVEPVPNANRQFSMRGPQHFVADASVQDPGVAQHGPVRYSSPLEAWIFDRNAVTYPPDYGWSRPVKRPILNRIPVQYYRMNPDHWYGDPRAFSEAAQFPMVYQPTDTTQLGYSYTRVPTWQPNPNMIPGPPWPSTWHRREAPYYTRSQINNIPPGTGYPGAYGPGYAYGPAPAEGYPAGSYGPPMEVKPGGNPTPVEPTDLPKGEETKPLPPAPPKAPQVNAAPKAEVPSALRIGQTRY